MGARLHLRDALHVLGREWVGATVAGHVVRVKIDHILLACHRIVIALEPSRVRLLMVRMRASWRMRGSVHV